MAGTDESKERSCPGERYGISLAICRTRQRNQYPKCLLCEHREVELAGSSASDAKVAASIFRSSSVLGRVPEEINEYVMRKVGLAVAQFLRSENPAGSRMAVACDLRENSRGFTRIFCEGVTRAGTDAANVGAAPPDLLAFLLGTDAYMGAAFIGGGNYADNVNGVRVWRKDGRGVGFGTGLEKVGLIARRLRMSSSRLPGQTTTVTPLADYVAFMVKFAPKLRPLKVMVDAGSGGAGRLVKAIFEKLPIELTPVNFEEDVQAAALGKKFPSSAMVSAARTAVREARADFGAAFDFAGERIVFFDERGELLRHDVAAGLVASEIIARNPEACIVYDLRSTAALRARITQRGGQPVSAPASRLAFTQQLRRSDALYGADLSGLHYFKSFFRFPSPFVALLMLASHVSRETEPVSKLTADLTRFSQGEEAVLPMPSAEAAEGVLANVRDACSDADRELIDGVTVRHQDWWFNLRQPGKMAELRLVVEGRTSREERKGRQIVERMVQQALAAVKS